MHASQSPSEYRRGRRWRHVAACFAIFALLLASLTPLAPVLRSADAAPTPGGSDVETIIICTPTGLRTIQIGDSGGDDPGTPDSSTYWPCLGCPTFGNHAVAVSPATPALPLRAAMPAEPPVVDRCLDTRAGNDRPPAQPRAPPFA